MKFFFNTFFFLFAGYVLAQQPSDVTFSLTLNQAHDPGDTYNNVFASDAGFDDRFVIGFNLTLTNVDGSPVNIGPIAAFCSEIQEPISVNTFTFQSAQLRKLAQGRAGDAGTASADIPNGGIGNLRAAQLSYLFDQYYISDDLTVWDQTTTDPSLHAFQLATWEITHDSDLDLFDTGGSVYVGAQSGGNTTLRNNAIALAQSYLDNVNLANVNQSYTSSQFDFWALVDDSGNPDGFGFQDVILATAKDLELDEIIIVPEMGTLSLAGLFLCGFGFMKTLRRSR